MRKPTVPTARKRIKPAPTSKKARKRGFKVGDEVIYAFIRKRQTKTPSNVQIIEGKISGTLTQCPCEDNDLVFDVAVADGAKYHVKIQTGLYYLPDYIAALMRGTITEDIKFHSPKDLAEYRRVQYELYKQANDRPNSI